MTDTKYDAYGNVTYSAQYDFGGSSPVSTVTTTYGSCTTCASQTPVIAAIGNYVNDKAGDVVVTQNGNTVTRSQFAYDSHGNLLTSYAWTGSTWLSNPTANAYNSNGTPSATYDFAGNSTTYSYGSGNYAGCGSCTNYPFPTVITKAGLSRSMSYYGQGGVMKQAGDANGNATTYAYASSGGTADPYWRAASAADAYSNTVYNSYPSGSSISRGSSFTFNSGNSIKATTVSTDGYGRPIKSQTAQSPSGTNYDTVSTSYAWQTSGTYATYFEVQTSQPCSEPSGTSCTSLPHSVYYDALMRPLVSTTTNNETLTTTYSNNDVSTVLTPAPTGENSKQVMTEYDGLGRVKWICKHGNGVSAACATGSSYTGLADTYAYTSPAAGQAEVAITRGSQTRYKIFDAMGRTITKSTPEGGTWTFTYDKNTSCPSGYQGAAGQLASSSDPNGNLICYSYDSLNRVTGVNANRTTCRHFYYDNSSGYRGTIPTGIALTNQYGRMVEAATDACAANTLITDRWFAYDEDGRVLNEWQSSPHSTQYYKSTATFFENGAVKTLQLASPSLYTMAWGLDGEGRPNTLADTTNSKNIVTSVARPPTNTCSSVPCMKVSLTGSDFDQYEYDPNTGLMTQYDFSIGSTPVTDVGNLTWNADRTLSKLAITDGFNSGGTQTCNFNPMAGTGTGYDDWGRLIGVDCGSGGWGQTFSYDNYDNMNKAVMSGRTGGTWTGSYSSTTNHYSGFGSYDSNGNVTSDGNATYGWNEFSKIKWAANSGTPTCGTSGKCITYDALGNSVETSVTTTYRETWYTQAGTVNMSGATPNFGYFPAPGGGTALLEGNNGLHLYMHKDWVGNARLISNVVNNTYAFDQAYSPYGEMYATFGTTGNERDMFGSLTSNFDNGVLWDSPNREMAVSPSRWNSPDPAGSGWNQYSYSTNPNSLFDPSGLKPCLAGSGVGGLCTDTYANAGPKGAVYDGGCGLCFLDWVWGGDASGWGGGGVVVVGADSGSFASAPQMCFCPDDMTSGILAGTASSGMAGLFDTTGELLPLLQLTSVGVDMGIAGTTVAQIMLAQAGCGGQGIPCYVLQGPSSPADLPIPNVIGIEVPYVVIDDQWNYVPNATVTEWTTSFIPRDSNLESAVMGTGSYVDTLAVDFSGSVEVPSASFYLGTQYLTANTGSGVNYFLRSVVIQQVSTAGQSFTGGAYLSKP